MDFLAEFKASSFFFSAPGIFISSSDMLNSKLDIATFVEHFKYIGFYLI